MNMREALIVLVLGAVTSGCATFRSARHESEGMYRVEAFFAEVDERQFQQLDLSWEADPAGQGQSEDINGG